MFGEIYEEKEIYEVCRKTSIQYLNLVRWKNVVILVGFIKIEINKNNKKPNKINKGKVVESINR